MTDDLPMLLTVAEVAELLRTTRKAIYAVALRDSVEKLAVADTLLSLQKKGERLIVTHSKSRSNLPAFYRRKTNSPPQLSLVPDPGDRRMIVAAKENGSRCCGPDLVEFRTADREPVHAPDMEVACVRSH